MVAWLATLAAGLALGLAGVAVLVHSGVMDWIDDMGRAFEEKHPWLQDIFKGIFGSFASLGIVAIDLVSGRIDKIPEDVGKVMDEMYAAWSRTWDRIPSLTSRVISAMVDGIRNSIRSVVDWIGSLNSFAFWKMPSFSMPSLPNLRFFAASGYVEKTGLAMPHQGEYVTSSVQTKTRNGPGSDSKGISIGQIVLQGKFEDEYQMYRKFISLLEREGRRVV